MKNNSYLDKIAFGVMSVFLLSSCDPPLDTVGPSICPSGDFTFTSADLKVDVLEGSSVKTLLAAGNTVDLSKGGLHIHSKFSEIVSWELKVSNDTEERTFSGKSDSLDIFWYGQGNKFDGKNLQFAAGNASIDLEVVCADIVSKKFTISGKQNFKTLSKNYGVLIRDWDKNGAFPISENTFSSSDGWAGNGSGSNPFEFEYYNTDPSPSGGAYGKFYAVTAAPSYYMGGTSFPVSGIEDNIGSINTDNLYLNIFVKADDDLPNSGSQVGFQASSVNYILTESITWSGWKLISHKLSDYKSPSGDPLSTTVIDNIILQIGAQPLAVSELIVRYDFALITVGEPLFKE